jgi:hypothetical protein
LFALGGVFQKLVRWIHRAVRDFTGLVLWTTYGLRWCPSALTEGPEGPPKLRPSDVAFGAAHASIASIEPVIREQGGVDLVGSVFDLVLLRGLSKGPLGTRDRDQTLDAPFCH